MKKSVFLALSLGLAMPHVARALTWNTGGGGSSSSGSGVAAADDTNFTGSITMSNSLNVTGVLKMDGSAGTARSVLTSSGASATPEYTFPPGMKVKLYDQVLVAPGTFTVTGLSQSYENLHVILIGRLNVNSNVYQTFSFNGNNPQSEIIQGSGTGGATAAHFTSGAVCPMAYSDLTDGFISSCESWIYMYSSTMPKAGYSISYGANEANLVTTTANFHDNNPGAGITTLGVGSVSTNLFVPGTRLIIYGFNY